MAHSGGRGVGTSFLQMACALAVHPITIPALVKAAAPQYRPRPRGALPEDDTQSIVAAVWAVVAASAHIQAAADLSAECVHAHYCPTWTA
jgi:hypothetical protein